MMRRSPFSRVTSLLAACGMAWLISLSTLAGQAEEPAGAQKQQEAALEAQIRRATARASEGGYLLKYRFQEGESLRMKVVQLILMQTRVDGVDQTGPSVDQCGTAGREGGHAVEGGGLTGHRLPAPQDPHTAGQRVPAVDAQHDVGIENGQINA